MLIRIALALHHRELARAHHAAGRVAERHVQADHVRGSQELGKSTKRTPSASSGVLGQPDDVVVLHVHVERLRRARATFLPMVPRPTMPSVLPASSYVRVCEKSPTRHLPVMTLW